jgi:hypothetical protein
MNGSNIVVFSSCEQQEQDMLTANNYFPLSVLALCRFFAVKWRTRLECALEELDRGRVGALKTRLRDESRLRRAEI